MTEQLVILSPDIAPYALRAAVEGIPVSAISRILRRPPEQVYGTLQEGLARGEIFALPKSDWPPTARMVDHLPSFTDKVTDDDMLFACRQKLGLTNLEAAFFILLLKADRADKTKLHNVIEAQRLRRSSTRDKLELTDPKMVDVMICKLRKKLRKIDPEIVITTVWGGGYYLEPNAKKKAAEKIEASVGATAAA